LTALESTIKIPVGNAKVEGNLFLPSGTHGVVVFAHGSGSSRYSPRNQYIAQEFNKAQLGTLLFDLLTQDEEQEDEFTAQYRFDIPLLAGRLVGVTKWLRNHSQTRPLSLGYFGASTGAAAALIAAAKMPHEVEAVVSRGGRPDLVGEYLADVKAPTLLVVGGLDVEVIDLNRQAMRQMTNKNRLVIVEGATHLFEEPGKLEEVARVAMEWFSRYLH
jgi:predicted alpha/beta-hydrolase family hydrolase